MPFCFNTPLNAAKQQLFFINLFDSTFCLDQLFCTKPRKLFCFTQIGSKTREIFPLGNILLVSVCLNVGLIWLFICLGMGLAGSVYLSPSLVALLSGACLFNYVCFLSQQKQRHVLQSTLLDIKAMYMYISLCSFRCVIFLRTIFQQYDKNGQPNEEWVGLYMTFRQQFQISFKYYQCLVTLQNIKVDDVYR